MENYVRQQMGWPEGELPSSDEAIAPRASADPDDTIEITDPNEQPPTDAEHARTLGLPEDMVTQLQAKETTPNAKPNR
jgi:hypothetical protein